MGNLEIRPTMARLYIIGTVVSFVLGIVATAVFAEPAWLVLAAVLVAIATIAVVGRSLSNQIAGRLRPALQRDLSALLTLHRLVEVDDAMPAPGGWAAEPDTLLALVAGVRNADAIGTVVECGSGTSTVWIALALRARGEGRLVSLEHEAPFREQTLAALERLGLADLVEVRYAPLTRQTIGGDTDAEWYAPEAVTDLSELSLLFVDGPPNAVDAGRRGYALDILGDRIREGGVVVLDDVARPFESHDLARWQSGPFQLEQRLARAAVLRRETPSAVAVAAE